MSFIMGAFTIYAIKSALCLASLSPSLPLGGVRRGRRRMSLKFLSDPALKARQVLPDIYLNKKTKEFDFGEIEWNSLVFRKRTNPLPD